MYEYRIQPNVKDVESSSVSNNNERLSNFSNKNLNQDGEVMQENGEELIEKGKNLEKEPPDRSEEESKKGDMKEMLSDSCYSLIIFGSSNSFLSRRFLFRLLANVSNSLQSYRERQQDC